MNLLGYLSMVVAVLGLIAAVYAMRSLPAWRCGEPLIGDALILIVYLLIFNAHYISDDAEDIAVAWHAFHLVVLVNIAFHIKYYAQRRKR